MIARRLACGAAALAVALPGAVFTGCGNDEPGAPAESAIEETTSTVSDPETTTEEPPEPAEPEVTDEGHEGGGPDPGTDEAESAAQHSGGTEVADPEVEVEPKPGGDADANASGGAGPADAIDQSCEDDPAACD